MIDVKADLPYPTIDFSQNNPYEVRLLMPSYGGKESETTAVMTYIYQHYISEPEYSGMSEILKRIAINEMKHHDLLGTMIVNFGGTPLIGSNYNYWQGGYVSYIKSPKVFLSNNIIAEKKAIQDYENIIKHSANETVKAVAARIIMDEEVHIKIFKTLLEEIS